MSLKNIASKKIFLVLLILLSSIVIFYNFPRIPKYLFFDEVEFARLALSLQNHGYIPYSEMATGHTTLYFYILLFSMKIFGISTFALRLPSAIFGILSVIIFYKISRFLFENKKYHIPFIVTILFFSLRWYINFARFSFEATFLLFLELSSIFFFFQFLRKKKYLSIILSAIFAGLAFDSYYPGRIFFALPLFFLLLNYRKYLIPYIVTFIIIISPLVFYFFTHADQRLEQQLYFSNKKLSINQKLGIFSENVIKTALMFDVKGDMNGRHNYTGKPALNPIIGLFFIAGLFLAIKNFNNFYNKFFLIYFLISLFPTLLTYPSENPNMLRTFTVIPSIAYFAGNTINYLINLKMNRKKLLIGFITVLLMMSIIYELRTYFVYQPAVFEDDAFKVKKELRFAL